MKSYLSEEILFNVLKEISFRGFKEILASHITKKVIKNIKFQVRDETYGRVGIIIMVQLEYKIGDQIGSEPL